MKKVTVVGLGYVGLPLALLADLKGYKTTGLDVDTKKIASLRVGDSYIDDVTPAQISSSGATFTTDASVVKDSDIVVICVPTPVTEEKEPDLGPVKSAITSVAPYLQTGTLVILESTVNPGVCDEIVLPLLEKTSGKKAGKDIYLAHCPERINPGDPHWNVSNINRVVGANTEKELRLAKDFYESIINAQIKPMASLKEAEAVKVVENSFRDINIAFVNELAMSFHKLGIDIENVIDGAATKPFAFMAHRPGCGVGGHCIPVDPYYLIDYARGYGFDHEFLRLARSINEHMPVFTVDLLDESLNKVEKSIRGTRIALLGLSYKANVGDSRESPALVIKKILEEKGADLTVYDPYIPEQSTVKNLTDALEGAAAVVIAAGHDEFKREFTPKIAADNGVSVLIDGRNMFKQEKDKFQETGIIYHGIGI